MPSRKRQTANVMVRRQALTRYQRLLDEQAGKASDYIRNAVDTYMGSHPDADTAKVREFVVDLMQAALPNFTTLAETLSCEFMQELCDAYGWDDVTPTVHDTTDYEIVEKRIRYLAGVLNDKDEMKFKDQVSEVTAFFVRRSAQDNMIRNCRDAEVRFARVPSGLETCAFCFMLASRGFVYLSEASAGKQHEFHPHCTCTIVPGARGRTKIDGYDPGTMYKNWKACGDTLGGTKQLNKDWEALPAAEKAEWVARHPAKYKGDTSSAKQAYIESRIMAEVETRDWHWLYTGEEPDLKHQRLSNKEYKKLQREKPKEHDGYVRLVELGFDVDILHEDRSASANLDAIIHVRGKDEYWELKTPRKGCDALKSLLSDGYSKWRRMRDGKPQEGVDIEAIGTPKIIVDNRYSNMTDEEAVETTKADMVFLTNHGSEPFAEALVILRDGSLRRLRLKE